MKKNPRRKRLIKECDKPIAEITKILAKFTCQRCDGVKPVEWLDAHHIRHRQKLATRWYQPNLVCLCDMCHRLVHDDGTEHKALIEKIYTDKEYHDLIEKSRFKGRITDEDLEEIKSDLEEKLKQLEGGL